MSEAQEQQDASSYSRAIPSTSSSTYTGNSSSSQLSSHLPPRRTGMNTAGTRSGSVSLSSSKQRFMSPGGGGTSPRIGSAGNTSSAASSSAAGSAAAAGGAGPANFANSRSVSTRGGSTVAPPSRYLVTVLPPAYLPHDPPHPRASSLCSGYSVPSKFSRGTLIPLYPTLSGQVAAIAREYGLPSTGGLVLYLVEIAANQPIASSSDALVGGPRISDEAWHLLWSQLFEDDYLTFSGEEDDSVTDTLDSLNQSAVSSVNGRLLQTAPSSANGSMSIGAGASGNGPKSADPASGRSQSPSEPGNSDMSSIADASSSFASEDLSNTSGAQSQRSGSFVSHGEVPSPSSARYPGTLHASSSSMPASPFVRPPSTASRHHQHSRRQPSQSGSGLRHPPSRQSFRTNRSYPTSISSTLDQPRYGESVIVGKLEFDIDNRRGGGRWFDAWLESAYTSAVSPPLGPGMPNTPASMPRAALGGFPRSDTSETSLLLRSRLNPHQPQPLQLAQAHGLTPHGLATIPSMSSLASEATFTYQTPDPFAPNLKSSQNSRQRNVDPEDADVGERRNSLAASQASTSAESRQAKVWREEIEQGRRELQGQNGFQDNDVEEGGGDFTFPRPPMPASPDSRNLLQASTRSTSSGHQRSGSAFSSVSSVGESINNATPRVRNVNGVFRARSPTPEPESRPTSELQLKSLHHQSMQSERSSTSDAPLQDPARTSQAQALSVQRSSSNASQRSAASAADMQRAESALSRHSSRSSNRSALDPPTLQRSVSGSQASEAADIHGLSPHKHDLQRSFSATSQRSDISSSSFSSSVSRVSQLEGNRQEEGDDEGDEQETRQPELQVEYEPLQDEDEDDSQSIRGPAEQDSHTDSDYGDDHLAPAAGGLRRVDSSSTSEYASANDAAPPTALNETETQAKDPLGDVFPNDAMTWAGIKHSTAAADGEEDSDDESINAEEVSPDPPLLPGERLEVLSPTGGIQRHVFPASASSSLDPFEFDSSDRGLNSPSLEHEDPREREFTDVKEVVDLLQTHKRTSKDGRDEGLSSPIHLTQAEADDVVNVEGSGDVTAKELPTSTTEFMAALEDKESPVPLINGPIASASHSRQTSGASSSSNAHGRQPSASDSFNASRVMLPPSDSERSLSSTAVSSNRGIPPSDSNHSLAPSMLSTSSSYPSISEPEGSVISDAPRPEQRGGRIPAAWAAAFAGLRSRGNSAGSESTNAAPEVTGTGRAVENEGNDSSELPNPEQVEQLRAEISRSRSSSAEMMHNLDEIEKALMEFSPRTLRTMAPEQAYPSFRQHLFDDLKNVESQPGYSAASTAEEHAPNTPLSAAVPSKDASTPAEPSLAPAFNDTEEAPSSPLAEEIPVTSMPPARFASLGANTGSPHSFSSPRPAPLPLRSYSNDKASTASSAVKSSNDVQSPGAASVVSVASTHLPYNAPTPVHSPPLLMPQPAAPVPQRTESASQITQAAAPHRSGGGDTSASDISTEEPLKQSANGTSKFGGLRLKGWGGGSGKSDNKAANLHLNGLDKQSQVQSEAVKSPMTGFKALKFWQKDDHANGTDLNTAAEVPLPQSPAESYAASQKQLSQGQPSPAAPSLPRIPRKSSLASLKAVANNSSRSDNVSPSLPSSSSTKSPFSPTLASSPSQQQMNQSYKSPPRRKVSLPFVQQQNYHPDHIPEDGQMPGLIMARNDTATSAASSGYPSSVSAGSPGVHLSAQSQGMKQSASVPGSRYKRPGEMNTTPELPHPPTFEDSRYLANSSREQGHVSSAPVTPAYAPASVVPSSGRLGRPVKGNLAKEKFRLSADSDLTKMLSHIQAIDFSEDDSNTNDTSTSSRQSGDGTGDTSFEAEQPNRAGIGAGTGSSLTGLGLGLPGDRGVQDKRQGMHGNDLS